jgi:5-methyltetrahydrofolate--homocysteine methyltransferase
MAIEAIYQAVLNHDHLGIVDLVAREVEAGRDVTAILNHGLIAAMDEVGKRFGAGTIYIPDMLVAARAMRAGVEVLRPHLARNNVRSQGTVVMGTVKGDLHDIGKNLVIMMLEGAGFTIIDLGVDVPNEKFLTAAAENKAELVAMSALLTTTMPTMEKAVAFLKREKPGVKVMVGGAPVTEAFAKRIGADGYGGDAAAAVGLARGLIQA